MFGQNLRVPVSSLSRQGLRTTLSVLGIAIGIGAVICTAALGAASTHRVEAQIDAVGEDFLWIRAGSRNVSGVRTGFGNVTTLVPDDAAALVTDVHAIAMCSPVLQGRQQLIARGQNWNTRYQAVWPAYFQIRNRVAQQGSLFSEADLAAAARVIVIGQVVSQRLFGDANPIGQLIRMNGALFTVVGVLSPKGAERSGLDRDDAVFVPLTAARRSLNGRTWVSDVMCGVTSPALMDSAQAGAAELLRERHGLQPTQPDDFQIQTPAETLRVRSQTTHTLSTLMMAVGAVSLVVGGVGIMNIMLVSVTERRREIGIRLAIGARIRDIRRQFLTEAAIVGSLGGAAGTALGWASAWIMSTAFQWPTVITGHSMCYASVTAIIAALVFGYYPAHRASRLDPIAAIQADK